MGRDRNHTTRLQVVADEPEAEPKVPGFERLAVGTYGEVWCSVEDHDLWKAHGNDPDRKRMQEHVKLTRHFQRFADVGTRGFTEEAFKPQGKQKSGHQSVQVWAFKSFQYRLYGFLTSRAGRPCFVGLATNPSKKDDKADPDHLKRVAERFPSWGSEEKNNG